MSRAGETGLGATRLIGDSFRLLFAHVGIFLPLALAPALLVEAINIALVPAPTEDPAEMSFGLGGVIATLLAGLVGYVTVALLCVTTLDALSGARRPLADYIRLAAPHALPLFVLGTIISIVAGVAMVFLIVPGLYVLAQFLVWVQAIVFERAGLGALGRAQALTKGYRWPLVGALVLLGLLFAGAMFVVLPMVAVSAAAPGRLIAALFSAAVIAFVNALVAIFTTLVYVRLCGIKEGKSAADIVTLMERHA